MICVAARNVMSEQHNSNVTVPVGQKFQLEWENERWTGCQDV